MARFRRIPIVVDAIQYDGKLSPAKKFLGIKNADYDAENRDLILPTTKEVVSVGDWIVKDGEGNFYPCKNEVFSVEFEYVEE